MMWIMLQQDKPDDYVAASGETHTVREFIEEAFKVVDIEIQWKGKAENEVGFVKGDESRVLVRIDPKYYRPTEVELLHGDATKAKTKLGWKPKTTFKELVREMVTCDLEAMRTNKPHAAEKAD